MFDGKSVLKELKKKYKPFKTKKISETKFDVTKFFHDSKHLENDFDRKLIISTIYDEILKNCLQKLDEFSFKIVAYHEIMNKKCTAWKNNGHFNFVCKYKNWAFICKWSGDPDIENGIFSLRNPENLLNGEKLDFYCDLFFGNTSKSRFDLIIQVMDTSIIDFKTKYFYDKLNILKQMEQRGFIIEKIQEEIDISNPHIHYKVTIPKVFQCPSDKIWNKNDKQGYFDEQHERENKAINSHTYYFNIFKGWYDDIIYTFSTCERMDANSYRDCFKTIENYWSDIKDFSVDGYINSILSLEKIIYNCYGYFENGQYYNGIDLQNYVNNLIKGLNGKYKISCYYKKPKDSLLIKFKVLMSINSTIWWYSEKGTNFLTDFHHNVILCLKYNLGDDWITITTIDKCNANTHVNGKLKSGDQDISNNEIINKTTKEDKFKWKDSLIYIENQCKNFLNQYNDIQL